MAEELEITVSIKIHADSSAAIGIVRRRGLGRIRHLDCTDLWLQERIRGEGFAVDKVDGSLNPADMLTKTIDRATLNKHLAFINCYPEAGRAESAPQLTKQA